MPSDLEIPLQLICSFEQVVSLKNRVQTVFLAYFKHGPLEFLFFLQRVIVREEVQLKDSVVNGYVICADSKSSI